MGVFDAFYDDLVIKIWFMIVELIKTCLKTSGMHFLMISRCKIKEIEVRA
jgi:hypothetical protein